MTRALAQLEKDKLAKIQQVDNSICLILRWLRNEDYKEMKFGNDALFCDCSLGIARGISRTRRPGTWNSSTGTDPHLQHRWVK